MLTAPRGVTALARRGRELREWLLQGPSRSVWSVALVGFFVSASLTITQGFPSSPSIHDEFSYLLSGDTFAHGRLTNPTHPMWRHFETFHVIQVPTYSSKYPPAQGLVLAAGQLLGDPVVGVWLSYALMGAAFTWMLQAWVGARWALYGGLGTAIWLGGSHAAEAYWATSYWGGAVAATGGALVLGGVRRLAIRPTVAASLATGAGIAVLANSRPFEGLLFSVVPAVVVTWTLVRQLRSRLWRAVGTTLAPMTLLLATAAVMMGLHNHAVTGSATVPPYTEHEGQYASSPTVLGQSIPERPQYRVAVIEQFYVNGNGVAVPFRNLPEFFSMLRRDGPQLLGFYVPFFVAPLLLALPWAARNRWMFIALACLTTTGIGVAVNLYAWKAHYAAPAAAAWCILLAESARLASQVRWRNRNLGRTAAQLVGLFLVLSFGMQGAILFVVRDNRATEWHRVRQATERRLASSGDHLILVEYGPRHLPDWEWVYNRADIDGSPIVWARSLGEPQDAALREYFATRTQWRLYVDDDKGPFDLTPLSEALRGQRPATR